MDKNSENPHSTIADDILSRSGVSTGNALDSHQKDVLRKSLVTFAQQLIGIPYVFGAEWTDYSKPPEALDCSELIEGVYLINGLRMPDGSQNQFDFTVPTGSPKPGDLGFFGKGQKVNQIYHVGMIVSDALMIEARGHDPKASFETGQVILRPREKWENWKDFVGYRSQPKLA